MLGSLVLGSLQQGKARAALGVVSIALGIALGFAVQLINGSAAAEFESASRILAGEADLTIRGSRDGFDERLYPRLATMPGVAYASPALEVQAKLPGEDQPLAIVGLDVFRAARLQPALIAEGADRIDLLREDTIFLSLPAMQWLGLTSGDALTVQTGLSVRTLRVAGALGADASRGRLAVMDIGAAQAVFGREGRISRIDVRLNPGIDPDRFESGLDLPPGLSAERARDAGQALQRMTRAYRVNLNVLALVALFTGGLLVFSTQALSVARRRSQLALLRVLGYTRRQVTGLLLAEGLLLGVAGAAAGLAGGFALASIALRYVGPDLGAGFYQGMAPALHVDPAAAMAFGLLGILAALAGSVGPALEAARAEPALALKSGDDQRAFALLRPAWPSIALLLAGVAASAAPPIAGLPVFGYFAIAALLAGSILLMPRLTTLLLARLPAPRTVAPALALAQLKAYPSQAALSLAAIVAAVSLMVSMAVMVASFRHSLSDWLGGVLPADLYLRSAGAGDTAYFSREDQDRLRSTEGLERIEFLRWQQVLLSRSQPRVTLLARDGVDLDAERRLPLVSPVAPAPPGFPRAWVSEPAAAIFGLAPGSRIELPLGGRSIPFFVAGVWRDYARQNGAVLIDRATYLRLTADGNANDAGLWLAPGAPLATVKTRIGHLFRPGAIELAEPGDIRALSLKIFDQTFAVTYALEAAAILIGLTGLSSAIGSQIFARRREFGMLRHIGVTRRQIVTMVAAEGLAVSAVGLIVGFCVGLGMSLILIHVVNRQSFHWGMELHVPWVGLTAFAAAMLFLATATAAWSGRQATAGDAVRAVKEDW